MVDAAMLRPGRLGKLLYVPLPDELGRADILKTLLRKTPVADDVDINFLAKHTQRFSGADLNALFREAIASAVKRIDKIMTAKELLMTENDAVMAVDDETESFTTVLVANEDFKSALSRIKASVSAEAEQGYLELRKLQSGVSSE
jgi:SpoVK/Ycf46/Vps4 family AAA+-type ATPase